MPDGTELKGPLDKVAEENPDGITEATSGLGPDAPPGLYCKGLVSIGLDGYWRGLLGAG